MHGKGSSDAIADESRAGSRVSGGRGNGTGGSPGRYGSEHGLALLTVLAAMAFLSSIAAFAVMQARVDYLIHHHTREALALFTTAESGLEMALADLALEPRFSRIDLDAGSLYPFLRPPPRYFPAAPYSFAVTLEPDGDDRVDIVARGYGLTAGYRQLAATVRRDAAPYVPGAVHTPAPVVSLIVASGFQIIADGAAATVPALAVESEAAIRAIVDQTPPGDLAQLLGDPALGVANLAGGSPPSQAVAQHPDATPVGPQLGAALGHGIFFSSQSLSVGDASGSGILAVDGDLSVDRSLRFDGIVVVRGDVLFADLSQVEIAGALLQETPGTALHLRGSGEIRYDETELARVETDFPGLLDRRAIVDGWRDDS
jgi:hypothetical protein